MADFPFDVVVFDLDGTLADTAPDLAAALNHALAALDRERLPTDAVRGMVGHGARALVRRGLAATGAVDEGLTDRALADFLAYYRDHIADGTAAFPGAEAALTTLADRGVRLAVCTNKPEALTRLLLARLGWEERFAAVVGGDTLPQRKPDPAPVREAVARAGGGAAAFVGDSINDAAAARAAGVPAILVGFGYSDRPAGELGAAAVIDHFDALVPALARVGG